MATIDGRERDVQLWTNGEDWAAIYIDGVLHSHGEDYARREALLRLLGVKEVQDPAFLRGTTGTHTQAAGTLDQIAAWQAQRTDKAAEARALREKANELLADAAKIEAALR